MPDLVDRYRTVIHGQIQQSTALSVGGSSTSGADECFRNGKGELILLGSGLAGALIETAAQVFPELIPDSGKNTGFFSERITGKRRGQAPAPSRGPAQDKVFMQSVWRFENAHLTHPDQVQTQWRQGIGIRQATGASAQEKRALFDFETVPPETSWEFWLEIDTFRGNTPDSQAEAVAVIALNEWVNFGGWFGRNPARGAGWFKLNVESCVRIPRTAKAVAAWANNQSPSVRTPGIHKLMSAVGAGATPVDWSTVVQEAWEVAESQNWKVANWRYLAINCQVTPGKNDSGYGLDVLQVAGHPAAKLEDTNADETDRPQSVAAGVDWQEEYSQPDAPIVTTVPTGKQDPEPFLPGSGIRGALRHTTSRIHRAMTQADRKCEVIDPNHPHDALAKQCRAAIQDPHSDESARAAFTDPVTKAFGLEELCSRVLVSDSRFTGERFRIVRVEHHAEDEFTAGVFGDGKFDSSVLVEGAQQFTIVFEAEDANQLDELVATLKPALSLAGFGYLPLGAGKWRGSGWVRWAFPSAKLHAVGSRQVCDEIESSADQTVNDLLDLVVAANQGGKNE